MHSRKRAGNQIMGVKRKKKGKESAPLTLTWRNFFKRTKSARLGMQTKLTEYAGNIVAQNRTSYPLNSLSESIKTTGLYTQLRARMGGAREGQERRPITEDDYFSLSTEQQILTLKKKNRKRFCWCFVFVLFVYRKKIHYVEKATDPDQLVFETQFIACNLRNSWDHCCPLDILWRSVYCHASAEIL